MPEANTNGSGGFDLSSLSSVLQNEDTMRQLRQMADSMGLGAQLEGALGQMQSAAQGSSGMNQPHPENDPNFSGMGQPSGNNRKDGYNNPAANPQQNGSRNNRNNRNNPSPNGSGGNSGNNPGRTPAGGNNGGIPDGLSSLFSNPTALAQLGRVMQAMNNRGPEYAFLSSLKPLLKPEKAPKVDQALQIMQMMQALQMVGGSNGAGLSGLMNLPGLLGLK